MVSAEIVLVVSEVVLREAGFAVEVLAGEAEVVGDGSNGESVDSAKRCVLGPPDERPRAVGHGDRRSKMIGMVEIERVGQGSAESFVGVALAVVKNGVIEGLGCLPWSEIKRVAEGE